MFGDNQSHNSFCQIDTKVYYYWKWKFTIQQGLKLKPSRLVGHETCQLRHNCLIYVATAVKILITLSTNI